MSAAADTQTVKQLLVTTRNLISDPAGWTRFAAARDIDGVACQPSQGVSFCLYGALCRAERDLKIISTKESTIAVELLKRAMGGSLSMGVDIVSFNDRSSHSDVLRAFDRAIAQSAQDEVL